MKNSRNVSKNGRDAVLSLPLEQETRVLTSCGNPSESQTVLGEAPT